MVDSLNEIAELADKYFGLSLPFEIAELKKAYRKVSKECHPDCGGDEERFKAMQLVYDKLILDGMVSGVFEKAAEVVQATEDGIFLSKLGLGLGPTVNGRDCDTCNCRGYETRRGTHYVICEKCDVFGLIPKVSLCQACKGSGRFTQAYTKRIVVCRLCEGSGIFKHPTARTLCDSCRGTKTLHTTYEDTMYYVVCSKCNGKGEIEIHNPVLPKGVLMMRG